MSATMSLDVFAVNEPMIPPLLALGFHMTTDGVMRAYGCRVMVTLIGDDRYKLQMIAREGTLECELLQGALKATK
jgi:hypothetical protein